MSITRIIKPGLLCIFIICHGCGAYLNQPMRTTNARIGEETVTARLLKQLPPPKEKIVTAVYKFRDQTGQYKPTENGSGWSTAVTQGATSILIRALEESNWFIPIERENVANLLNERKIIRSSRAQYQSNPESEHLLPPLLYAGIILEGGIISYDANILTGGAGIRYFGTGGSGKYRQDRVTIYLRAISTASGKILNTVYTSKTILSQAIDVGVFRFVRFQRLLEAETGITVNEPSEMAVTAAIEKAVQMLVIEGIMDNHWEMGGSSQDSVAMATTYFREKQLMQQTDLINRNYVTRRQKLSTGVMASAMYYQGDMPGAEIKPGWNTQVGLHVSQRSALQFDFGQNSLSTKNYFDSRISYGNLSFQHLLLPYDRASPYFVGGGGIITRNESSQFDFRSPVHLKLHYGVGLEYMINDHLGFNISGSQHFMLSDNIDEMTHGKYNDSYWQAQIGVKMYLGPRLDDRSTMFY